MNAALAVQADLKHRESGRRIIVKRSIINVVMVAVGLGMSLTGQTSQAAETDMRLGSFHGNWCGYVARFDITSRRGNTQVFDGKIWIKATGQYDNITVVQYASGGHYGLRIDRKLTGRHSGKTQTVVTYPPETRVRSGRSYVNFITRSAVGFGAAARGHLHLPK